MAGANVVMRKALAFGIYYLLLFLFMLKEGYLDWFACFFISLFTCFRVVFILDQRHDVQSTELHCMTSVGI